MSNYTVSAGDTGVRVAFFPARADVTADSWRVALNVKDLTLYLTDRELRDLAAELHNVVDRLDEEGPAPTAAEAFVVQYVGGPSGGSAWQVLDGELDQVFRGTHPECVAWIGAQVKAPARANDVEPLGSPAPGTNGSHPPEEEDHG